MHSSNTSSEVSKSSPSTSKILRQSLLPYCSKLSHFLTRQNCGKKFKYDFQKLTFIWVIKWAIILFTCDARKFGAVSFKPCPNFLFFGSQMVRNNNIRYYGFKYIFLNKQTFRLMKMIKKLGYKSIQIIVVVSRDSFKIF